ncbi:hypothetical protein BH24ACT3_BH24ACT3_10350 [soil metagenome]
MRRLLAADYLGDLTTRPLAEVRAMRAECQEVETGLSYLRRMVQGRLDIVGAELTRRREGGDPDDIGELISRLPDILAEPGRPEGTGRLSASIEPTTLDPELAAELEAFEGDVDRLGELDLAALDGLAKALADVESRISERRRALFDHIDPLQAEITRRYRTGEATIDRLLP